MIFFTAVFAEFDEKRPVIEMSKQHRPPSCNKGPHASGNNVLVARKTTK